MRSRLGIRTGTQVEFALVADRVELRVARPVAAEVPSGFGLLKARRAAVRADFDGATLLKK